MAQLILGGPNHRYATERFRHRMDTLLNLHDTELALEELGAQVWYMVTCAQCEGTPPVPFEKDSARQGWVNVHVNSTGHRVIKFEEPRRSE